MAIGSLILTVVALLTVIAVPGAVALARGVRRSGALVGASLAAAGVAAVWVAYWLLLAQPVRTKHAILFAGLALVALVAASFSRPTPAEPA